MPKLFPFIDFMCGKLFCIFSSLEQRRAQYVRRKQTNTAQLNTASSSNQFACSSKNWLRNTRYTISCYFFLQSLQQLLQSHLQRILRVSFCVTMHSMLETTKPHVNINQMAVRQPISTSIERACVYTACNMPIRSLCARAFDLNFIHFVFAESSLSGVQCIA